ncbi:MAG TPA: PhzF family phenazine biosynthesis protein [Clostridia bacterium]|nr:PhzF family phenazine biosynthesis protein [Clostridia bacterium]
MKYFIVDAFSDRVFQGNQAGVCIVDRPLKDEAMQSIAAENNLAETAFVSQRGEEYDLRWFTPEAEIDLCGHATLASAYILANHLGKDRGVMRFHTLSGVLGVTRKGDLFELDFPSRAPVRTEVTPLMERAVGCGVLEAHRSRDLMLLVEDEESVRALRPDMGLICQIPDCMAVVVTAKGDAADFVSRFFAPKIGIPEDPVTGSSHATLIPFWAGRLNKNVMTARQLSRRGGTLYCEYSGERVKISGKAALYLAGEIESRPEWYI